MDLSVADIHLVVKCACGGILAVAGWVGYKVQGLQDNRCMVCLEPADRGEIDRLMKRLYEKEQGVA